MRGEGVAAGPGVGFGLSGRWGELGRGLRREGNGPRKREGQLGRLGRARKGKEKGWVDLLGWFQGLVFYFPFLFSFPFLFFFQTPHKLFEFK